MSDHVDDKELLEMIALYKAMGDRWEDALELARECSSTGEKDLERRAMQRAHVFGVRANQMAKAIREKEPRFNFMTGRLA